MGLMIGCFPSPDPAFETQKQSSYFLDVWGLLQALHSLVCSGHTPRAWAWTGVTYDSAPSLAVSCTAMGLGRLIVIYTLHHPNLATPRAKGDNMATMVAWHSRHSRDCPGQTGTGQGAPHRVPSHSGPKQPEEIVIKSMDESLLSTAQENSSRKEDRYSCYQELVVKSLMHLGKFEKNVSVQTISENLNDSGIQSLRAESDEAEECFLIHSDDGRDKIEDSQPPFCSSDDNESNSESAENGWDSGSNFSEETKPPGAPKYVLTDHKKDVLEVPEIKTEGDKFIPCENRCDSETERKDPQNVHAEPLDGSARPSFPDAGEEDSESLAAMTEESKDLEKAKGNLSLLEQAIALQAERGCVFHNTYKELDRFLLEHLAGERRQTKIVDMGGRQIFNNKRSTLQSISLHLCFAQQRRDLQTKGHRELSVGCTWAGASCLISSTLSGFLQTVWQGGEVPDANPFNVV
ncbi:hypothetical protein P7K49_026190 [Saguinus oedipus]|uniref:Uncharacterized protein n=1 Tax=Saguinus oedipus TaxID=9490 RepID=A0ABQ9UCH6_SAGOE|nr:hypothetical protein P7K49_026190 [Saguinus oedipus]